MAPDLDKLCVSCRICHMGRIALSPASPLKSRTDPLKPRIGKGDLVRKEEKGHCSRGGRNTTGRERAGGGQPTGRRVARSGSSTSGTTVAARGPSPTYCVWTSTVHPTLSPVESWGPSHGTSQSQDPTLIRNLVSLATRLPNPPSAFA